MDTPVPTLAIRQANDVVPGTVPRITGPGMVLVSADDGGSATWIATSDLPSGGTSKPIAPVDAIQTAAFPGTYSAGTWTATDTGALAADVFDGYAVPIGKSVEFNALGVAAIGNGVFERVADTSDKPTFARRADANTGSLLSGALYGVLQGTFPGQARQVFNSGAITLDTTPINVGPVREKPLIEKDLSKAPYFMQGFPDRASAIASGLDFSDALEQFLEDSAATMVVTTSAPPAGGMLGRPPDGVVPLKKPIFNRGFAFLRGSRRGSTSLCYLGTQQPGVFLYAGVPDMPPLGSVAGFGDTGCSPFTMRTTPEHWFNLSEAKLNWYGDTVSPDTQFDCRLWTVPKTLPSDNCHLVSTRGSRNHGDRIDEMHRLTTALGQTQAVLRTLDANNIKQTAGAAHNALVLSGTTIPDTVPLYIEILSTSTMRYSLNNGTTFIGRESDGNEVHTFVAGTPYPLSDRARGTSPDVGAATTFVTFPAGTYANDQKYSTVQTTTLVATTLVTAAVRWERAHTYDGTTTRLAINNISTGTADPASVSIAQTGKMVQFYYEETMLAFACNDVIAAGDSTFSTADEYCAGISYTSVAATAAAAPGGFPQLTANTKFWFTPYDVAVRPDQAIVGKDGKVKYFKAAVGGAHGGGTPSVVPRGAPAGDPVFLPYFDLENVTLDCTGSVVTALTLQSGTRCSVQNIAIKASDIGIRIEGATFFCTMGHLDIQATTTAFMQGGGQLNLVGRNLFKAGRLPFVCSGGTAGQIRCTEVDNEGSPDTGVILDQFYGEADISVSDESSGSAGAVNGSYPGAMIAASVPDGRSLKITGGNTCSSTNTPALLLGGSAVDRGKVLFEQNKQTRTTAPRAFIANELAVAAGVPFVELAGGYASASDAKTLANKPEYFLKTVDAPLPDAIALTNASVTITRDQGGRLRMAASTATGPLTITLGATNVHKGQPIHWAIFPQGSTITIANGGTGGGTIASGTSLFGSAVFNGTDWEQY